MHEKYTTEEMDEIWSEKHKLDRWWDVELAVLEAYCEMGEVDESDLDEIKNRASWTVSEVKEVEREVKHDLLSFLQVVQENLGPLSAHVHRGLTSSDVKDTARAMRVKESLEGLAEQHRETVMIGRTHGVHAEPTTFGLRCLNWLEEWRRQGSRLERVKDEISVGKISGAVGTYAQVSPELEELALERLGLDFAPVSTQIIQRDRHASVLAVLANIAGTVEKMALEVRNLQRTEILELQERFEKGQKGSSAMPHKKNPILAERLCGQARCVRGYAQNGFETQALWHERDLTNSSTERITFPDAFNLVHYMVQNLFSLFDGLKVHSDNMLQNLDRTRGLIYSQRVLLALADAGWSRREAYEKVQKLAEYCWENNADFEARVRNDDTIVDALAPGELDRCFSPDASLDHLDTIYERVLGG